jgi:hypothetical protein
MEHFRQGLTGQKGWTRQWREPETKPEYDVVIIGGGLHGLATAYYLAMNVLKHGKGVSYRELLNAPSTLFIVKPTEDIIADEAHAPAGLVDICVPGFFAGLTTTILEAYHFLENR